MVNTEIYGKNVFVTGASSGIGRACARMFAENGFVVTGVSRNTDETTEVFPGGGSLTLRKLDVTDEPAVRKMVEDLPGVDIAILCAGMGVAGQSKRTHTQQAIPAGKPEVDEKGLYMQLTSGVCYNSIIYPEYGKHAILRIESQHITMSGSV